MQMHIDIQTNERGKKSNNIKCLRKVLGHYTLSASMCLNIDSTSLWNCTRGMSSILPNYSLNDGDGECCLVTVNSIM